MFEKVKTLDKQDPEGTNLVEEQNTGDRKVDKMSVGSQNDSPIKIEPEEMDDSQDILNGERSDTLESSTFMRTTFLF